jgi:hypothetical protein
VYRIEAAADHLGVLLRCRDVLEVRGLGADHHGTFLLDQPLGSLDPDARGITYLFVIAAILTQYRTVPVRIRTTVPGVMSMPSISRVPSRSSTVISYCQGSASTFLYPATSSMTPLATTGGMVSTSVLRIPAPVLLREAVVPVIVLTVRDLTEAVDLGSNVVVYEERIVPARMPGVAAHLRGERQILLGARHPPRSD